MTDVVIDLTRPAPLPDGVRADIADDLARAPGIWRPHLHGGSGLQEVRVVATESYDAWVICRDGVVSIRVSSPPVETDVGAIHDASSYVRALDALDDLVAAGG